MSTECTIAKDYGCPYELECGGKHGILYIAVSEKGSFPLLLQLFEEGLMKKRTETDKTWRENDIIYACKPGNLETEAESGR